MNTNCFFPKGFSPLPNKTPKSAARYTLRRVTHNVLTLRAPQEPRKRLQRRGTPLEWIASCPASPLPEEASHR